jgi:hypothetical protein
MKFNNKPTFEMLSVKAKHDGFEIEFTQPLKDNLTLKETDLKSKGVNHTGNDSDDLLRELIFKIMH